MATTLWTVTTSSSGAKPRSTRYAGQPSSSTSRSLSSSATFGPSPIVALSPEPGRRPARFRMYNRTKRPTLVEQHPDRLRRGPRRARQEALDALDRRRHDRQAVGPRALQEMLVELVQAPREDDLVRRGLCGGGGRRVPGVACEPVEHAVED